MLLIIFNCISHSATFNSTLNHSSPPTISKLRNYDKNRIQEKEEVIRLHNTEKNRILTVFITLLRAQFSSNVVFLVTPVFCYLNNLFL